MEKQLQAWAQIYNQSKNIKIYAHFLASYFTMSNHPYIKSF